MTTLPHSNPENGYALRISKNLPKDAANLAYVHTDTPSPEKNLVIFDYSTSIIENNLLPGETQTNTATTDAEGYLVDESGPLLLSRPEVLLSDSYSLGSNPKPLFYVSSSRELFDARNALLSLALNGAKTTTAKRFEQYRNEENNHFVYEGEKIRLTQNGGKPLADTDAYKIRLEKSGTENYSYRIVVESNFQNGVDGYEIHYPAFIGGKNIPRTEVLNPKTNYLQVTAAEDLTDNTYLVEASTGGYKVRLSEETDNPFYLTPETRPPYRFNYQIEADIQTRLSDKNPTELAVGLIYVNDTVFNAVKVTTAMKKLVYQNQNIPSYLTFHNPHNENGSVPSDSVYWLADLQMPKEHYLDYDLLILSGYGDKDLTTVADSIRGFLSSGGTLLLDNCGTGVNVLNTKNASGVQTFVANVGFSTTTTSNQRRILTEEAAFSDRYFDVTNDKIGNLGSVAPTVELQTPENLADWTVQVRHENSGPSLLKRSIYGVGSLIVSNMGLMLDVLYGKEQTLTFLTNYLLDLAENRSFLTPVFTEQVHHRDNLYAVEYTDRLGKTLYVDDQNDADETQIVAKKLLANSVTGKVSPYLPKAYQSHQSAAFRVRASDSGAIPIQNAKAETLNATGLTVWQSTTEEAVPGWDFVAFSGTSVTGEQSDNVFYTGSRSLKVTTTASQGFWEQNIGILPAGKYLLEVRMRAENAQSGSFGFYTTAGEPLIVSVPVSGTLNWTNMAVSLELLEATEVLVRMGALTANTTTTLYFDDIRLSSQGVIRMTPDGDGTSALYAYAISAKGKNLETVLNEATDNVDEIVKIDTIADGILTIKSFVYEWDFLATGYKKKYGEKKETTFRLNASDDEKVVGRLITLLPALKAGREWAKKDRVYYEATLVTNDWSEAIELSLYDPSTQSYFFTPAGEWVINHEQLWWNGYDSTVQVRAALKADSLKTTGNRYSLQLKAENQIRVFAPATTDERDRWYLRVQNGSFQKNSISAKDSERIAEAGRPNFYEERLVGEHRYELPEYRRQTFYPVFGQRFVYQERATYLNDRTIQVKHTPLIIEEEQVVMETLAPVGTDNRVFRSRHLFWNRNAEQVPRLYLDEFGTNNPILLTSGFVIDYDEGIVTFATSRTGTVLASYKHDNFRITKRKYANKRVRKEKLPSGDRYTFDSKHENWLVFPAPVFTRNGVSIHPAEYAVDYQSGTVRFFQKTKENISADYSYYDETEVLYADANRFTGEIRLPSNLSFREEVYVSYLAEENTIEYKGYYDEDLGSFLHLDLNPTAGHTFTLRQNQSGTTKLVELPSEKLLGKEILLYLLPRHSVYYTSERTNEHCLRHVFGQDQWLSVKAAHPEALLLSKLQVRENTDIKQAVVLDARRAGGGLKESVSAERIAHQVGYTSAFWDIDSFDGLAYYKNGVSVVRVPERVLRANGGPFEESEVRRLLDKYLAYGIYPIIEYTNDETEAAIIP